MYLNVCYCVSCFTLIVTFIELNTFSGLPLAGKFSCKRKFWPVQGKGQGNQIYQDMARKFEHGQGNCEEILKIVYIRNKIELKVEIYLQKLLFVNVMQI